MRNTLLRIISILFYTTSTLAVPAFILSTTKAGRDVVCRSISHIVNHMYDVSLSINGWDGTFHFSEISYSRSDMSLCAKDVSICNKDLGDIKVEEVSYEQQTTQTQANVSSSTKTMKLPIPKFINSFKCNSIKIKTSSSQTEINSVDIKRTGGNIACVARFKNGVISATTQVINDEISSCNISLENIASMSGAISIDRQQDFRYKVLCDINTKDLHLKADSEYHVNTNELHIQKGILTTDDELAEIIGCIFIHEKRSRLKINGRSKNASKYAHYLHDCVEDIKYSIEGDVSFDKSIDMKFAIQSGTKDICSGSILGKDKYHIDADKFNQQAIGFKMKRVIASFSIDQALACDLQVYGDNWSCLASASCNKDHTDITKLEFHHNSCDAKLIHPISIIGRSYRGSSRIECKDIKFLEDVLYNFTCDKLRGACEIDISLDNSINAAIHSESLSYSDITLYGGMLRYSNGDFSFSSQGIDVYGYMCSDITFKKTGDDVFFHCSIEKDGLCDIYGKTNNNALHISKLKLIFDEVRIFSDDLLISNERKDNFKIKSTLINICGGECVIDIEKTPKKAKGSFELTKVPLSRLNKIFKYDHDLLHGLILNASGDLSINNACCLGDIIATLEENNRTVLKVKSTLEHNKLNINTTYNRLGDSINLNASIPVNYEVQKFNINEEEQLHADLTAYVKLNTLFVFSDDYALQGNMSSKMTLDGTLQEPLLNGRINIQNGAVETSSMSIKNITIDSIIRNSKIIIQKAIAQDKNSYIDIRGSADFEISNYIPRVVCDWTVKFANYDLINSDNLLCNCDGEIKATGPINCLTLSGPLKLRGRYDTTNATSAGYKDIRVIRKGKKPKRMDRKEHNSQPPFVFDIRGNCEKLRVVGKSVDALFNGNLNVVTFDENLSLDGALRLIDGHVNMVGVKIKLRQGDIRFQKERPLQPYVHILGNSIVRDMQVFLEAENKKSGQLTIDIYSKPSYSVEDILSKIIFNRSSQELHLEESTKLREAIKNMRQQDDAFSSLDFIKELFILDTVSFSQDDSASRNGNNTVSAGKYINDKIYIGVEKATEKEASYKVQVNVSPQVTIHANSTGDAGVSWMYRY